MSDRDEEVQFSLRSKLLIFGSLLAALPAAAVGWGLMDVNATTLKTQSREMRLAVADGVAQSLESFVTEAHESLLGIQQILTNRALGQETRIETARALVEADTRLETVAIYDEQGGYVAQVDQSDEGFDRSDLPDTLQQRAREQTMVIDRLQFEGESPSVELSIALRPEAGRVTGYLRTRLPLTQVQQRLEQLASHRVSGRTRIDVVDSRRQIVFSSEPSAIGETLPAGWMLASVDTVVEKGVAQSGEHPERPVLVSMRPLARIPWVTRIEEPVVEAYASLYRMRWIVGGGTLGAVLVALAFAWVFSSRLTGPLERVVAFSRQLGQRAFETRVEVQSSDEIGVVANSLNEAAADLQESEAKIAREIEIRSDLGRYLSEDLVDNVVQRQQTMDLGGQRRDITVMFADVVRFTPMCEHHPPEVVVTVLNELFTLMTTLIFRNGGTVDKFLGDCVMAFWGAPQEDDHQIYHALDTAEHILRVLEFANQRWMRDYGIEVELAIGIHSGEAIVGNIGSETRMDYTAIGAVVNRAARLEALARANQVLVTETIRRHASDRFDFYGVSKEVLTVGEEPTELHEVMF